MPKRHIDDSEESFPTTRQGFRKSSKYILESMLTSYDYVPETVRPVGLFESTDQVYLRCKIIELKSRNTWRHSHMRLIKKDEKPLRVISRTVGGVQRSVDLFSFEQTEPVGNLVATREAGIPLNQYGNVDIDAIPQNASLIPSSDMTNAIRACKNIPECIWCRCQDGWRKKKANFVGVVVLDDFASAVQEAINTITNETLEKEERIRTNAALAIWRTLIHRIKAEYYIRTNIDR